MKKLVFRRIAAFSLDYIIIISYALILFGITKILNIKELELTPISGQLLGFLTLILPVFLYFFLTEKSNRRATIGKRTMKICIYTKNQNLDPNILLRNIIKFLPWEIAHTGVHWVVFYSRTQQDVPIWIWFVLIIPQIIIILYLVSIIISNGESALYDRLSNTKVNLSNLTKTRISNVA